jgi:hypothetical protein
MDEQTLKDLLDMIRVGDVEVSVSSYESAINFPDDKADNSGDILHDSRKLEIASEHRVVNVTISQSALHRAARLSAPTSDEERKWQASLGELTETAWVVNSAEARILTAAYAEALDRRTGLATSGTTTSQ